MTVAPARGASSPGLVRVAVDGHGGWRPVQAIVTDPMGRGGLRDRLPPGLLELVRSKYKPGRKLTAYYRAAGPADEGAGENVAVSWLVDGQVRVLRSPADPSMPQLARLSNPATLATLLETFTGPSYSRPVVRAVRYRPGQRHVLVAQGPRGPAVYVKTDRDDSGARAVPAARFFAAALERRSISARVAEPLGHASQERASLWWQAPGRPATALVAKGRTAAPVAALAGRVARVIHDSPTAGTAPDALGLRDVQAEAAAALRAGEHITALLPAVGRTYRGLVGVVLDELDRLPGEPVTLVHGDLKADNLLVDGDLLSVLDLDRVRWAEPALDLGKFLADLCWWSPAADAAALQEAFRAGYGACDPVRWARAELLAALFLLELAARRAVLHDGGWQLVVRGRVLRAVDTFSLARSR